MRSTPLDIELSSYSSQEEKISSSPFDGNTTSSTSSELQDSTLVVWNSFDDDPLSPAYSSHSSSPNIHEDFLSPSSPTPSSSLFTSAMALCSSKLPTRPKLLKFLDFLINDIIVVIFSLVDIVLDLLVCKQFYMTGRMTFFYISVIIFFIAQLSYSFLFVATWGKNLNPGYKMLTFLLILPFGQLVPFFTWIESFHFTNLDNFIKWTGLTPTSESEESTNNQQNNPELSGNNDMLWDYIQHKYQSHAGFVAEALAEAIPQCILQTIALITQSSDNISPVIVLSILMSICVISSKGYLISYSIHRPTFIFNFICIIADCFNLFATCSWLFQHDIINIAYHQDLFYIDSSIINQLWIYFFLVGCFFLVVGGLGLTVFSMIDDHLKLSFPTLWVIGPNETIYPWFHFYLVRTIAWFLAIIPVCVVFLTTKLTLIPILVFHSLDPEHALHWNFYLTLYNFLQLHLKDSRIKATNCFILECRQDLDRLKSYLQRYSVQREDNGALRDRESRKRREEEVLIEWLQGVGKQSQLRNSVVSRPRPSTAIPSQTEEDLLLQQALLESILQLDETAARQTIRQSALQNSLSNIWKKTRRDLALRSALFYRLEISQNPSFRQPLQPNEQPNDRQELINRIYQYPLMFYSGMCFMTVGLINGLLFIPSFFLFITYGSLYPIIHLITTLSSSTSSDTHLLSIILTAAYIFFIFLLILLAPAVSQFQLFRTDIVDLKEFPIEFYHPAVVKEIHRRFNAELDRKAFEDQIETRLGQDMLRYIRGYVEDYHKIWK